MENEKDDRWLEAASLRDWLDRQIKIREEQERTYRFNDRARCYYPDREIPVVGSKYITDLLDLELTEVINNNVCVKYPFRYSFEYGGVRFCELSKERLAIGEVSENT